MSARDHLEGVAQVVALLTRQPDAVLSDHAELIQELDTLAALLHLKAIVNKGDRWCDRWHPVY